MLSTLLIATAVAAQPAPACSTDRLRAASIEQTQAAWLDRFNALDLPCFMKFFAADASMFAPFPVDDRSRRIDPGALADFWQKEVFDAAMSDGLSRLNVRPQDVAITRLGRDAALATFHLSGDAHPNRRTLVWRRDRDGWRIVHVHASRIVPHKQP